MDVFFWGCSKICTPSDTLHARGGGEGKGNINGVQRRKEGVVLVSRFGPGWRTAFLLATGLILTRLISEDACLCLSLPKLIHVQYSTP
jgi:hypothetical protein